MPSVTTDASVSPLAAYSSNTRARCCSHRAWLFAVTSHSAIAVLTNCGVGVPIAIASKSFSGAVGAAGRTVIPWAAVMAIPVTAKAAMILQVIGGILCVHAKTAVRFHPTSGAGRREPGGMRAPEPAAAAYRGVR